MDGNSTHDGMVLYCVQVVLVNKSEIWWVHDYIIDIVQCHICVSRLEDVLLYAKQTHRADATLLPQGR